MKTFYLPDLGEGLAEAEIREWYIKEGDDVKVDQPMVSMETAKALVDVPAPHTGKILKLYGQAGQIVQTGAPLVEFVNGDVNTTKDKGTVVGSLEESTMILDAEDRVMNTAQKTTTSIKAMPAVRALAQQLKVDLSAIVPSGTQGQITIDDVKRAAQSSTEPLSGQGEALHGVRRAMALVMTQSHKEVVPVTLMDDADITDLNQSDITVAIIQAMIAGIKAEPNINAWFYGKSLERSVIKDIHIGLAVDTEEGLFVPVLKDVTKHSPTELRAMINHYKKTVRDRTLLPSELHGATITLSNFGTIAGRYANPVVVPPAVAILGCGRLREEARVYEGKIAARSILPLSLTFDHRAVTGGEATRFLATVIKFLEKV